MIQSTKAQLEKSIASGEGGGVCQAWAMCALTQCCARAEPSRALANGSPDHF
jgi:hypothetical protein